MQFPAPWDKKSQIELFWPHEHLKIILSVLQALQLVRLVKKCIYVYVVGQGLIAR